MKEQKTVKMRKYQRKITRAAMEQEGILRFCRRSGNRKQNKSFFAANWKKYAKRGLKKRRRLTKNK